MVRYALALAGQPLNEASKIDLSLEVIDIMNNGQLDETFLCEINPEGKVRRPHIPLPFLIITTSSSSLMLEPHLILPQVPVLTSPTMAAPLPDSVEITHFISKRYPSLTPPLQQESIQILLKDLHELSIFALSFLERPFVAEGTLRGIDDLLSRDDISDRYRKALKYKHAVYVSQ